MKVKIIKANKKFYWYKNWIGEFLEVQYKTPSLYQSVKYPLRFIDKTDCIEIPENWCIRLTSKNKKVVIDYMNSLSDFRYTSYYLGHYYGVFDNYDANSDKPFGKELTFEEFQQIFLNTKTMEKKIIGYKLIKSEYKEAACSLSSTDLNSTLGPNIATSNATINDLKRAGVLDLWFEPIYKKEKIILTCGDKKLPIEIIPDQSIIVDNTNVDIKHLEDIFNSFNKIFSKLNDWHVKVTSLKIGCSIFTLEEIKNIIDTYNGKI